MNFKSVFTKFININNYEFVMLYFSSHDNFFFFFLFGHVCRHMAKLGGGQGEPMSHDSPCTNKIINYM